MQNKEANIKLDRHAAKILDRQLRLYGKTLQEQ
jgi:hypothetical protein